MINSWRRVQLVDGIRASPSWRRRAARCPTTALTPMIEVNDPKYASADRRAGPAGAATTDNLAFDGHGHLWVHEDIPDNNGSFPANGIDVSEAGREPAGRALRVPCSTRQGQRHQRRTRTPPVPGISGGYRRPH